MKNVDVAKVDKGIQTPGFDHICQKLDQAKEYADAEVQTQLVDSKFRNNTESPLSSLLTVLREKVCRSR